MRTIGNLDLVVAFVVLVDAKALHVVRHVVGGAGVQVPVGVTGVAVADVGVVGGAVEGLGLDRMVEARVAPQGVVAVNAVSNNLA